MWGAQRFSWFRFTFGPTLAKPAVAFSGQVLMSSLNITSGASVMTHYAKMRSIFHV